jgi:hypothetical protein
MSCSLSKGSHCELVSALEHFYAMPRLWNGRGRCGAILREMRNASASCVPKLRERSKLDGKLLSDLRRKARHPVRSRIALGAGCSRDCRCRAPPDQRHVLRSGGFYRAFRTT